MCHFTFHAMSHLITWRLTQWISNVLYGIVLCCSQFRVFPSFPGHNGVFSDTVQKVCVCVCVCVGGGGGRISLPLRGIWTSPFFSALPLYPSIMNNREARECQTSDKQNGTLENLTIFEVRKQVFLKHFLKRKWGVHFLPRVSQNTLMLSNSQGCQ